jgi:hypothetical protein
MAVVLRRLPCRPANATTLLPPWPPGREDNLGKNVKFSALSRMKVSASEPAPPVEVAVLTVASMGASGVDDGLGGMAMFARRIDDLRNLFLRLCGLRYRWFVCRRVACVGFGGLTFGSGMTTTWAVGVAGRLRTLLLARADGG